MAFNGTEGEEITLDEGAAMTAEYRSENPGAILAHFFGKDILNEILSQDGCMGIRMYYGIDSDEKKELVLVGVDANGDDMTELVADRSLDCPNHCSKANALNS